LIGQGIDPFEAGKIAVYLHGLTGDMAAAMRTQHAMLPTDLIEFLPDAFHFLGVR
jgi:NAD(P)H-hydrate epimerase